MVLGLIIVTLVVALAIALIAKSVQLDDPWIESELEAMEAVDRLLEAGERARREMRQVTGRSWSSSGGETR